MVDSEGACNKTVSSNSNEIKKQRKTYLGLVFNTGMVYPVG